jgi:hypothetical protein
MMGRIPSPRPEEDIMTLPEKRVDENGSEVQVDDPNYDNAVPADPTIASGGTVVEADDDNE